MLPSIFFEPIQGNNMPEKRKAENDLNKVVDGKFTKTLSAMEQVFSEKRFVKN